MDRYVRVEQRKTEQPSIQENEVRIMAAGKMRNYISYATTLLTVRQPIVVRPDEPFLAGRLQAAWVQFSSAMMARPEAAVLMQDKGHSAVVLKAMGRAINKTVTIGAHPHSPACSAALLSGLPFLEPCSHIATAPQGWCMSLP